jgi:type I restriction enzyme S subunit
MMNNVPTVKLEEVLSHRGDFITVDDMRSYKRVTAQLHAKGIVLRDEVEGVLLKTKKQRVCKAGDFLVAEIDAKLGGFGIVPPDLAESIVSSHYFLFDIDTTKLAREYLGFFIRTEIFQKQIVAQGSTNYAAIRPQDILQINIPLPTLQQQRMVIKWIKETLKPINGAKEIRKSSIKNIDGIIRSILNRDLSPSKHPCLPMKDVTHLIKRKADTSSQPQISSLGVKWWGKGAYVAEEKNISELRADRFIAKENDVIYNDMWARHGSVAIIPKQLDGFFASAHFPTWELDLKNVYPPFFSWCFRSPWFWQECEKNAQGSTGRNAITKQNFKDLVMPVPPLSKQHRIVAHLDCLQAKVDEVKRLQADTERDMVALVPAVLAKAFGASL